MTIKEKNEAAGMQPLIQEDPLVTDQQDGPIVADEWKPSNQGISIPIDMENTRNLFQGLVEILSLAESKAILEEQFKDLLDNIYLP